MALTAAPTVGGLAGTASARAAQETGAVVAGLTAQQNAALAQAAHRAAQQGQLATAAGTFLEGLDLGGKTASDYANAAAAQTAAAQGFQGGLQQTVSDAAAQVQANLAAGGSSQTAYNPGQAAGNALYGLGGYLPSAQLGILGPSQAASMRTFAPMVLGYGQQLAAAALGTGQQAAAAFTPEIAAALARQPALAASYLDALQDRARQAEQDRIANAQNWAQIHNQASQFAASQRAHIADRNAEIAAGNKPTYGGNYKDGIYKIDQRTGKFSWVSKPTATDIPTAIISNTTGQWLINTQTGAHIARLGDPVVKAAPPARIHYGEDEKGQYAINQDTQQKVYIGGHTPRAPLAPSNARGTAPSVIDSSKSNLHHYYTNQYGFPTDEYGTPLKTGQRKVPVEGWKFNNKGRLVEIGSGPKPPKRTGPRPLTVVQRRDFISDVTNTLKGLRLGGVDPDDTSDTPVVHPALSYTQALGFLSQNGYLSSPELVKLSYVALRDIYGDQIAAARPSGPK